MKMAKPTLDSIKDSTEKAATFVEWLVEVLRGKNWVKKLLLLDTLIFIIFNPVVFSKILDYFVMNKPLPENYTLYFWLVIGLIFLVALTVAIRTRPGKPPSVFDPAERSTIKGLRPFGFEDAELFGRLQREDVLRECLNVITDRDFQLGILYGESGCGKTSFLQAGIWPMIPKQSESHKCIYVKFTDLDPFDTIRQALKEQTQLSDEDLKESDFPSILEKTAKAEAKTIVLLFDQLEQFFVNHPRREQRQPFLEAMANWYKNRFVMPVKILFSLRSDFIDRLFEFQKAMGYSLGAQDTFRLEKFTPEQATEIFQVIAKTTDLSFDRSFVEEMTKQELADREDGLISPVDIQILSWVINGQKILEERGFNRKVYQKLGGIEGLLENFLSRAMASIVSESRRQAALKVMLALIDLERNVRAGVLTLQQIQQKLAETVTANETRTVVAWLAQSKVRLIIPSGRNGSLGYELAHERLISALRRLAGKELSESDQAN